MPVTSRRRLVFALVCAVALPVVAGASSYTITLHNGNTFRTRYQPQAASWDASKVLFRTDAGNMISILSADVASIDEDSENRGFGKVLNATTVMLGNAPNDLPQPPVPGSPEALAAAQAAQNAPPEPAPAYNINQFVEPSQTQGIPGAWIGSSTSGNGPQTQPAAVRPPGAQ